MSIRKTHPVLSMMNSALIDLPAPSNITHMWNFGSMLGICMVIQLITGIFLAMHYTSDISLAFSCVSHITRDVSNGWLMRLIHANGASLFFFIMYLHMGRGLFFNSYNLKMTWAIGVTIFLITMLTAFLGYVLPWGQMSYWGATVITNLLSAVPYLGQYLVEWVWGGFSVSNSTLTRFFSIHYLFPFIILMLIIMHLVFLHEEKSSNPMGIQMSSDKIPFHPYFSMKDLTSLIFILFIFFLMNMSIPFFFMDPENFIPANPLSTPVHIQPEWYFLFAYAILRSIPNKLGGVLALIMSIMIMYPLSLKNNMTQFNKTYMSTFSFWSFFMVFLFLTWLGMKPVESPFTSMGVIFTYIYFSWFILKILE